MTNILPSALIITTLSAGYESADGKTFSVEKGADFKVVLGLVPSTGFQRRVVSTTRELGYPTPKDGTIASAPPARQRSAAYRRRNQVAPPPYRSCRSDSRREFTVAV